MGEDNEKYIHEYKSGNIIVRAKNKPNITLVAKAIIKLQENLEIQKLLEKKQ